MHKIEITSTTAINILLDLIERQRKDELEVAIILVVGAIIDSCDSVDTIRKLFIEYFGSMEAVKESNFYPELIRLFGSVIMGE